MNIAHQDIGGLPEFLTFVKGLKSVGSISPGAPVERSDTFEPLPPLIEEAADERPGLTITFYSGMYRIPISVEPGNGSPLPALKRELQQGVQTWIRSSVVPRRPAGPVRTSNQASSRRNGELSQRDRRTIELLLAMHPNGDQPTFEVEGYRRRLQQTLGASTNSCVASLIEHGWLKSVRYGVARITVPPGFPRPQRPVRQPVAKGENEKPRASFNRALGALEQVLTDELMLAELIRRINRRVNPLRWRLEEVSSHQIVFRRCR